MATKSTMSHTTQSATFRAYKAKIDAEIREAKARLDQFEAKAKELRAKAELAAIDSLKTARQHIDEQLQDLKTSPDVVRAKSDIDAEVDKFKLSIDELDAKFKTESTKH